MGIEKIEEETSILVDSNTMIENENTENHVTFFVNQFFVFILQSHLTYLWYLWRKRTMRTICGLQPQPLLPNIIMRPPQRRIESTQIEAWMVNICLTKCQKKCPFLVPDPNVFKTVFSTLNIFHKKLWICGISFCWFNGSTVQWAWLLWGWEHFRAQVYNQSWQHCLNTKCKYKIGIPADLVLFDGPALPTF